MAWIADLTIPLTQQRSYLSLCLNQYVSVYYFSDGFHHCQAGSLKGTKATHTTFKHLNKPDWATMRPEFNCYIFACIDFGTGHVRYVQGFLQVV